MFFRKNNTEITLENPLVSLCFQLVGMFDNIRAEAESFNFSFFIDSPILTYNKYKKQDPLCERNIQNDTVQRILFPYPLFSDRSAIPFRNLCPAQYQTLRPYLHETTQKTIS